MSVTLFNKNLKEARRDALVNHYLATHDFSSLPKGSSVKNADDLYEYLLLDTKISDAVTTSRLTEATSSLQLFIHRALEGYDGELAKGASALLAKDTFLDNWDKYNKRYNTWAGKEKLRFYAANYVDPTLRSNKTELFKQLEEHLSQGKFSETQVVQAFNSYLSDYHRYANITHLSVGNGPEEKVKYISAKANGKYYWRMVTLGEGYKPIKWGEWQPLPTAIDKALNDDVVVAWHENKITCGWNSIESIRLSDGKAQDAVFNHIWKMNCDNTWVYFSHAEKRFDTTPRTGMTTGHCRLEFRWKEEVDGLYEKVNGVLIYDLERNRVTLTIDDTHIIFHPDVQVFINNLSMSYESKKTIPWTGEVKIELKKRAGGKVLEAFTATLCPLSDGFYGYIKEGFVTRNSFREFSVTSSTATTNEYFSGQYPLSDLFTLECQSLFAKAGYWYYKNAAGDINMGGDALSGPYGQYLWEIFFHIPFLIATRFATERRFDDAERWYKYIFNSAGYRDRNGKLLTNEKKNTRYWNCLPLEQDIAWDSFAAVPASTDPDVIASADPMHYKLAVFMGTLDLLIARGDAAYRTLERDTLTEAKMYYVQAQQLLGPRPDIRTTSSWDNPMLYIAAKGIAPPATRTAEPQTFSRWLKAGDSRGMGDGNFLPPCNDVLLAYWDKLDIRLWNLRHNLSLDGQPLNLPLFATLADPAGLHRQQQGGDGAKYEVRPSDKSTTGWRYPLLADHARSATGLLTQFGNSLLSALERRDAEQLTLLLQTQQIAVLAQQQGIAGKNLDSLRASLESLQLSRTSAELRKTHYANLVNGDLSPAEQSGLTLRSNARTLQLLSQVPALAGGLLSALPNTFGLANGGGDLGAPFHAQAQILQAMAGASDQSAVINDITAGYQRRAEEWGLQRDIADREIGQLDAQIDSLKAQIAMQQKQIALTETESAHAQQLYKLQSSRFTSQALYNWMVSRLSTLYYQMYDATIPVCMQARTALTRELGEDKAHGLFRTAVWSDLYQGLLAGEGLTTELQKLNNVWLQYGALGLEATRTVSLAALRGEETGSLSAAVAKVLSHQNDSAENGILKLENQIFSAQLDMSKLKLEQDYGATSNNKKLRIKSIAVTLPTLLGPYQDIAATLSVGNETATLSHGLQDSGRFITNLEDSRFQPFEGLDVTSVKAPLTLSIFSVKEADDAAAANQRAIVENLSDIIFHIRYIMR
ncbi:Tc toxin subunit A-related protein [Erwinia pyrifoliae]|uniref:Tc toxin subunit A-related protein n=1 Tax=Erwinia pyrifoliae TaxID=79967 RepID=UPI00223B1D0B|nr:neuraminidase-like domain-containing protein [Erwinia pyrifoliae]MCT2385795.1 Insecticidal toxin complex protein TcaB (toxin complex protein) [Erwinia pyrifoliae]MCU8588629.1 Insecticidal toxin complex protein TcaB (toxin complex protein) [Erwinia pyrifoliae]